MRAIDYLARKFPAFTLRAINGPIWRLKKKAWLARYDGHESGRVYDVSVDDFEFKMSFLDYPVKSQISIIERIEGVREPQTVAQIKAMLYPGAKVLELGACYGYFTNIMAQCVGPTGKVVSVEGTPNTFEVLQKNIERNNLSQVEPHNAFISNDPGEFYFSKDDIHPYFAIERHEAAAVDTANLKAVKAVRLSEFLDSISFVPDFIFMDIEGFETEVIDDLAGGWLQQHKPVVLFEIHHKYYKEGRGYDWLRATLANSGYVTLTSSGNCIARPVQA